MTHTTREDEPGLSPTAHLLDELQLYGYRPGRDDPDPRPLPDAQTAQGAIADIFDALVSTLNDTRLEPDLDDLLWSVVNLFHRRIERLERDLGDNEAAQRRSQREQDGSEVASVELERLLAQGLSLINAATPLSSCATSPPTCTKRTSARHGGRARDRRSTMAR